VHSIKTTSRRRRGASLAGVIAVALLGGGLAALPTAAAAAPAAFAVGFESASGWSGQQHIAPDQYPAADVVASSDARTGAASLEVSVDPAVNGDSGWRLAYRPLPSVALQSLELWAKPLNAKTFVVRVLDSTGQTHQLRIPLASPEWQRIEIPSIVDHPSHASHGGAADGEWHGPAMQIGFLVEGFERADTSLPAAGVLLDDIVILQPAEGLVLDQAELGNVFSGSEQPRFPVSGDDSSVDWTITDLDGTPVQSGTTAISGGSGEIVPAALERGWYRLDASTAGGSAATTFAVLAEPLSTAVSREGRFGTATHYGQSWGTGSLPLIAEAGIGTLRDELFWGHVEKTPGVYDWASMRAKYMDQVEDSGTAPLLIAGYGNPFYDGGNGPVSPAAVEGYAEYAASMASEFGDIAAGIEIWNEWDIGLGGNTNTAAEHYVNLLAATAPAVRAAAPGLPIIGPAVALLNEPWFERTMQLGALEHLDGVVLHAYSYPGGAENLDATLNRVDGLIRQYNDGDPLPMWITEHGWPTGTGARAVDERTQAANLAKSALISAAHDVELYVVYDFQNDGLDAAETENNFGLVHHPSDELGAFTPKPGYVAYSVAATLLTGADFVERHTGLGDVWDYEFAKNGGQLRALWATTPRVVELPAQGVVTVTDLGGASREIDAGADGRIVLDLASEPVYVTGDVGEPVVSQHSLRLDAGYVGTPVTGTWTVDNTGSSGAATFRLAVGGTQYEQTAAAGASATLPVEFAAPTAEGRYTVHGTLTRTDPDAAELGMLTASTTIGSSLRLTGEHAIDAAGSSVLRLTVFNASQTAFTIEQLDYTLAGTPGSGLDGAALAARGERALDVPLDVIAAPTAWTATATVSNGSVLTASGTVQPLDTAGITEIPYVEVTIDGVIEVPDDYAIDLATEGVDSTVGSTGPEDLSGRVWLSWDDTGLTLSAEIVDDIHDQPRAVSAEIWRGDSIQFSIARGAPGEAGAWSEFGVALGSDGPLVHRWLADGETPGQVPGAVAAVERDEAATTTTYEVTVPWERLGGIRPETGLLSASVLVNEADSSGRAGWIEWGGGIAGAKDSALFKAMRLLPEPEGEPEPKRDADVGLSVGSVRPGDALDIDATGFEPGETVTVTLFSDPQLLLTTAADGGGAVRVRVVIPRATDPGAHRIVVESAAALGEADLTVLALGGGGAGGLANTGATVGASLAVAALLLMGGMMLMRRRRRA